MLGIGVSDLTETFLLNPKDCSIIWHSMSNTLRITVISETLYICNEVLY